MTNEYVLLLRAINGLLCLAIIMVGIRWQARTFLGDLLSTQRRMISAGALAGMMLVGVTIWCAYATILDSHSGMTWRAAGFVLLALASLSVAFLITTWFGPLLLAGATSWAMYTLLEYGEAQLVPIFALLVLPWSRILPAGSTVLFAALTLAHAFIGSIYSLQKTIRT